MAPPGERHLVHPVPVPGAGGLGLQARPAVYHDQGVASRGARHGELQRSAVLAAPAETGAKY